MRCPRCGEVAPAGRRLCGRCWGPLPADERQSAGTGIGAAEPRVQASRRRLPVRRAWPLAAVALLALALGWCTVGARLLDRPSPLPAPASPERSASLPPAAWSSEGGGPAGTRTTAAPARLDGDVAWQHVLPASPVTSLVADGERLYVGLDDGTLRAIRLADGREAWRVEVPGRLDAAPALAGDRLYAAYRDATVHAIDTATGEDVWAVQRRATAAATPLVLDGMVYVAASEEIVGLDAEDGRVLWEHAIDERVVVTTPVASGDRLVAAAFDRLFIFDRETGRQRFQWRLSGGGSRILSTAVTGEQGVVTVPGGVRAFDLDQQRPWWDGVRGAWNFLHVLGAAPRVPWAPFLWTVDTRDTLPAVAAGDLVIVATAGGLVQAFDARTGAPRWETRGAPVTAAPLLTADGLLVPQGRALALLDPRTGDELARRAVGEDAGVEPVDDVIVVDAGLIVRRGDRLRLIR